MQLLFQFHQIQLSAAILLFQGCQLIFQGADLCLLLGDLLMGLIDPRISFVKKEGAR